MKYHRTACPNDISKACLQTAYWETQHKEREGGWGENIQTCNRNGNKKNKSKDGLPRMRTLEDTMQISSARSNMTALDTSRERAAESSCINFREKAQTVHLAQKRLQNTVAAKEPQHHWMHNDHLFFYTSFNLSPNIKVHFPRANRDLRIYYELCGKQTAYFESSSFNTQIYYKLHNSPSIEVKHLHVSVQKH